MQKIMAETESLEQNKLGQGFKVSSNTNNGQNSMLAQLLIIVCLSALAYLAWSTFWLKFSRAEVFFAECSREMLVANNFITPLYHGQPFFDKPIFVYWLIIAMFKLVGVSHLAARVPVVLASLLNISCIALAGARVFGKRAGLLASLLLASSFMYLSFSCLCMSDLFLVLFDTLSLTAIYAGAAKAEKRTLYWWLAAVSMGFAFLTKGPVGVILPAITGLLFLAGSKKLHLIKAQHICLAVLTLALIASPWFYAAYLANGPQSMVHFFIQENLQRFAGATYDAHKPFWYPILSFFLGFAPWSPLVPLVFLSTYKNLRASKDILLGNELSAQVYLWLWIFVAVGFFCFSRGKCDYYTLPAFPAAALLVANYLDQCQQKYMRIAAWSALFVLAGTIIGALFILPQINRLLPVDKYAKLISESPKQLRVGLEPRAASWVDEILFQSGKDPQVLADTLQMQNFIDKGGPVMLILSEDKYGRLEKNLKNRLQIVARDSVATHPITPGFLVERSGNIADAAPLVVATNFKLLK